MPFQAMLDHENSWEVREAVCFKLALSGHYVCSITVGMGEFQDFIKKARFRFCLLLYSQTYGEFFQLREGKGNYQGHSLVSDSFASLLTAHTAERASLMGGKFLMQVVFYVFHSWTQKHQKQ